MRTLIALAIVASSFAGFSAPAFAGETKAKADVACLTAASAQTYKWVWYRGGNGRCNGSVRGADIDAIVAKALKGQRKFKIAFYIPSMCRKGDGWTSVDVVKVKDELRAFPWDKDCKDGEYFAAK